ncbi:hypothetical protein, partial [Staphylococcus nepalensis]|uniref:hypothetical protein n=1 Tax=Staphylococcus nepalensis TaxID=214473 RepID=UPI00285570BE
KEPINVDDIPESWYEPAKIYDFQTSKPKKTIKQTTNIPFEPSFDGVGGDKGFKNDDYGFKEYNYSTGNHFSDRASRRRRNPEIE